ncbi:MAG: hypothetical protein ACQGVK_11395 [Myxococcota bacterium]
MRESRRSAPPSERIRERQAVRARRLGDGPIVSVDPDHPGIGDNVNGPSLIRVPPWVREPLGRYYLYFAHHRGGFIRLAHADRLEGPWQVRETGVLAVGDSTCIDHVASPDVVVDEANRQIRLYFHGVVVHPDGTPDPHDNAVDLTRPIVQRSKLALSSDGLHFEARQEILAPSYLRVFRHGGAWYGLAMPGILYRSSDGLGGFERGPQILGDDARHHAVAVRDGLAHLFFTRVGDRPERVLHAEIDLGPGWLDWTAGEARTLLEPQTEWEGAGLALAPSVRGQVPEPVRQLRDPAFFSDDDGDWLLYSVAGERGIALASLSGL